MVGSADWNATQIAELGRIITGGTPPSARPECFGSEFPFITPTDLQAGDRAARCDRFLSPQGAELLRSKALPPGSVCFTCIGATIGKACITTTESFTNQQINSIIVDTDRYDPFFVFYLLAANAEAIKAQAGGAATPILNKSAFGRIVLSVPGLPTQQRVGEILSGFDELTENNTRRIRILEEMAQAIYREWFVEFRYPGHENVPLVDSELGPIPEGWSVTSLVEHATLRRRNVMPGNTPEELFDHYSIPAFDESRLPVVEPGQDIKSGKYQLIDECVLLSKLNPRLPRVWRFDPTANVRRSICSTEFLVLEADVDWPLPYVCALVADPGFGARLASMAGGTSTSHQRAKPIDVMALPIASPRGEIVEAFAGQVAPMFRLADNLVVQNRSLRMARDVLLPRLISGDIDVSGLPEVA